MYAIIATGGKQYKVAEGDVIRVEKLGAEAGSEVRRLLFTSTRERLAIIRRMVTDRLIHRLRSSQSTHNLL